jgi:hypothetical protein
MEGWLFSFYFIYFMCVNLLNIVQQWLFWETFLGHAMHHCLKQQLNIGPFVGGGGCIQQKIWKMHLLASFFLPVCPFRANWGPLGFSQNLILGSLIKIWWHILNLVKSTLHGNLHAFLSTDVTGWGIPNQGISNNSQRPQVTVYWMCHNC